MDEEATNSPFYMVLKDVKDPVVYLCSEFAIDNYLPTYAGGLGILAGDYIDYAAYKHYPMVGIGILYKGKDYMQRISAVGKAETEDAEFDHDASFLRPTTINNEPLVFTIDLGETTVKVKAYHIRLSDTTILF